MSAETGMSTPISVDGYNHSHFTGLRRYYHYSRFYWLSRTLKRLSVCTGTVLELGCMDGKTLEFLPFVPQAYYGFDAEPAAVSRLNARSRKRFPIAGFQCTNGAELLAQMPVRQVDVCISMETLEHVSETELDSYLVSLKQVTRNVLIITVPNERGAPFLVKHGLKQLLRYPDFPMTAAEFLYSTVGKLHRVRRLEHRGFDYVKLVHKVRQFFPHVSVEGVGGLPLALAFTIGVVAQSHR